MRRFVIAVTTLTAITILVFLILSPFSMRTDAPPPVLKSSPLSVDQYKSSFLVPVSMTASKLALIIDEKAQKEFSGTQEIDIGGPVHNERLNYTIRRGGVSARADNDNIQLSIPLHGRATAKAKLCPFGRKFFLARKVCTRIRESADLRATVNATLSNIRFDSKDGKDWKPHADLDLDVDVTKAKVRILGNLIPISFKGKLTKEINSKIPDLIGQFDDLLDEIDVNSMLAPAWNTMHRTLQLSREPNTWLTIEPVSLGMSSVSATSDLISASIFLSSDVSIHFGGKPETEQRPILRKTIQPDATPTFRIRIPIMAELDELAAQLNTCCSPVFVSLNGDESLIFSNLTLREHRGRLLMGADFAVSGWWKPYGTLYILATPALNENTLQLKNLEFTVESESVLTEVASDMARPLIVEQLKKTLQIDLAPYYEEAKERLASAVDKLNMEQDVNLTVEIDRVELINVSAGDGKLALVGELAGVATIGLSVP